MPEPRELATARRHLAFAEAELDSADGLARLAEGVGLLDDVIVGRDAAAARTAGNLAASYAARIYERIGAAVAKDPQLPEPKLEHYFKVVLALDQVSEALPPAAAELKLAVAGALIDRYYEGHSPEQKRRALEQLAALKGD
ncbi:MAG: hypothetical protein ABI640_03680 [Gammaproteobacteria bacterium]